MEPSTFQLRDNAPTSWATPAKAILRSLHKNKFKGIKTQVVKSETMQVLKQNEYIYIILRKSGPYNHDMKYKSYKEKAS